MRLIRARELENVTEEDGRAVQYLRGDVEFQKGNTVLSSQRAYYRQREGLTSFVESVQMTRERQVLTVDSLVFDSNNDIATGFGHVHFTDGEYDLTSDTLTYFMNADSGIASGHVRFVQRKQIITARHLIYRKREGEDAASYTALGSVTILEEERKATCGKSIYDATEDFSVLLENPVVVQEGQTLSGNEIHLHYRDDTLERLTVPDRAHIVYRRTGKVQRRVEEGDSVSTGFLEKEFVDDMTGRRLEAYLVDGKLDSVRLEGMATTLYHLFQDSVYEGENVASGDTITLLFKPDSASGTEMESVHIVGGSRGEYHPSEDSEDITAPIFYRGETIHYDIPAQRTDLEKSARIDYQDTRLEAGHVTVTWEDNLLRASPGPDTLNGTKLEDFPTFFEKGRNPMVGTFLTYDMSTGRGTVTHGKTKMEDGYYTGHRIRNRSKDVFFVEDGIYTTCDLDPDPHFYFESHKMKMITDDKIIVKPIVLYIREIPLFALPFGVFPDQGGKRHSGWIMPSYGETGSQGQYLKGLGYFWAVNDYVNSEFILDFYDKRGIVFRSNNRYSKRYSFSGNLGFTYNRKIGSKDIADLFDRPSEVDWAVRWGHNQKLRHNQTLYANASYYSNSQFNRKLGIQRNTRLDQKAVSNATYSKRWPKASASLSVNLAETRNLMAQEKIDSTSLYYQVPTRPDMRVTETSSVLPTARFRKGQKQLFGGTGKGSNRPTYYWSFNSTLKNIATGFYESDTVRVDSLGPVYGWNNNLQHSYDNSLRHNLSFSGSHRLFKYISIRPSLRIREDWTTKYFDATAADSLGNPVDKRAVSGFRARHTATLSLGANTKLYGLFPVHIGSLRAIRHTVTPSIGFSFQPDYSKPFFGHDFGYFKTLQDSRDNSYFFDPFSGTPIGGTPRGERRSLNLSLKNLFQAKVRQENQDKKIDNLLTWNMTTNYNFAAERFKMAKLKSSIRTKLPGKLTLDISLIHDFYDVEATDGTLSRIDRIATNRWGIPTPRLLTVSMATGFRLTGKRLGIAPEELATQDTTDVDTLLGETDLTGVPEKEDALKSASTGGATLWDASVGFRYATDRFDPSNPKNNFWMGLTMRINLSKSWRIRYTARVDLLKRDLVSQDVRIYRDLHCWELAFSWTPGGFGRGFYLRINVKSPSLKDLKIESRGGQWRLPGI